MNCYIRLALKNHRRILLFIRFSLSFFFFVIVVVAIEASGHLWLVEKIYMLFSYCSVG